MSKLKQKLGKDVQIDPDTLKELVQAQIMKMGQEEETPFRESVQDEDDEYVKEEDQEGEGEEVFEEKEEVVQEEEIDYS